MSALNILHLAPDITPRTDLTPVLVVPQQPLENHTGESDAAFLSVTIRVTS